MIEHFLCINFFTIIKDGVMNTFVDTFSCNFFFKIIN